MFWAVYYIFIFLIIVFLLWIIISYFTLYNTEEPDFSLVKTDGSFEIRDYAPYIIAQVKVKWKREEAIKKWFNKLSSYIFWDNETLKKHPSYQYSYKNATVESEVIPMTVPVMEIPKSNNFYVVQFVMPRKYNIQNIPVPRDSEIQILEIPMRRRAIVTFNWNASGKKILKKTKDLKNIMLWKKISVKGKFVTAIYNPPFTFPFIRRNEIMVDIG